MSYHKFRTRLTLATIVFIVAKDIVLGRQPHDICSFDDPFGFWGLVVVLAGLALRSWATGIRGREVLATTGPYAFMRHPLYVGTMLQTIGFCLILGSWENFVLVLAIILPLHLKEVFREEKLLDERFGAQWLAFAERTGRFYPKSIPSRVFGDWSCGRWMTNREYGTFLGSLVGLAMIKLWQMWPV